MCGFSAFSSKALRCPECRKKNDSKRVKKNREKSNADLNRPKLTMREVLQRLEVYNKENNTHLSYGQFMVLIEKGEV